MNMSLPSRGHVGISPLEHQAFGILEKYSLLKYSLPLVISLSPFEGLSPPLGDDISLPLKKVINSF